MLARLKQAMLPNSSRHYLRAVNAVFAADVPEGAMVLDAGAGDQPYRDLFAHCSYESADLELVDKPYANATYICDLAEIPVEDGRFDAVVLNQVLEHLPEPRKVLAELHRVLKPGGRMICTCPLFYEEHETPYDFYRYTQFAHQHLFEKAGFAVERIDWMEGYFGTVAYQFETMGKYLPLSPSRYLKAPLSLIGWPVVAVTKLAALGLAALFYRLDMAVKITDVGYPKNYVTLARRPD